MILKIQVEVLTWLASVSDYMDMDRVAIHGWSYGGYLSLMALVQYPELFKVSIVNHVNSVDFNKDKILLSNQWQIKTFHPQRKN